jgi:hypothetical protein
VRSCYFREIFAGIRLRKDQNREEGIEDVGNLIPRIKLSRIRRYRERRAQNRRLKENRRLAKFKDRYGLPIES